MLLNSKQLLPLSVLVSSLAISACSSTEANNLQPMPMNAHAVERLDQACVAQVHAQQQANSGRHAGVHISLARLAQRCISDINFSPAHPDNQTAMQLNAVSVMNYLKAGELESARNELKAFKQRFPQQDLLMHDHSSFIDNATLLLHQSSLSERQSSMLNVSARIRNELARHQYWSRH